MEKLSVLADVLGRVEVTGDLSDDWLVQAVELLRKAQGRLFFIGNGGSAAIASHMAIDWMNKAGVAAMSFNDGASLTCLANDYGYKYVFEFPLHSHARSGDMLFAISSSGRSENILWATEYFESVGEIITFSGFSPENALRKRGTVNYYVPSSDYGIVETAHLGILHALLDKVAA